MAHIARSAQKSGALQHASGVVWMCARGAKVGLLVVQLAPESDCLCADGL